VTHSAWLRLPGPHRRSGTRRAVASGGMRWAAPPSSPRANTRLPRAPNPPVTCTDSCAREGGRGRARPRAQALEVLRKLAASSDANLGALRAAGALDALLELLRAAPPASGRAAGAVHLLRDLALYAPGSRCARCVGVRGAARESCALGHTAVSEAPGARPGSWQQGFQSVGVRLGFHSARCGACGNVAQRVTGRISTVRSGCTPLLRLRPASLSGSVVSSCGAPLRDPMRRADAGKACTRAARRQPACA